MRRNLIFVSCALVVVLAIGVVSALGQKMREAGKTYITPTPTPFGGIVKTETSEPTTKQEPTKAPKPTEHKTTPTPTEVPTVETETEENTDSSTETGETKTENLTETEENTVATTEGVATPTPVEPSKNDHEAVKILKKCSADELKLAKDLSEYTIELDDWTTMVMGIECYCVNVVQSNGSLAGMFYVATDGTRAFRLVDDDEFEEMELN